MRRLFLPFVLSIVVALPARGQQPKLDAATKAPPVIADNSFLVEEAYNQEEGVVQHISTYLRTRDGSWGYTFTQEWPAPTQRHQLSYTVPILRPDGIGTGVGDLALNYRYQALGKDEESLWFSPRLSLYLPTGDVRKGRGAGGPGIEVMLPVSIAVSDAIVTHWDAGATLTRADNSIGGRGLARGVRAAASAIWLMAPNFNLMLESTVGRIETFNELGERVAETNVLVSPGVRGAFNVASGLQIVPGIAVPIGVGPSRGQRDLFLYLSFEHPFK
jgi:hypothetical protein